MPYALPHAMPSGVPRALGYATVNDAMCNCFCNCFYTTGLALCTAIDDAPRCAMCPRLCNSERCNMQLLLQLLMYRMACPMHCLFLQIPPSSLYRSSLRRPSPPHHTAPYSYDSSWHKHLPKHREGSLFFVPLLTPTEGGHNLVWKKKES